MLGTMEPDFVEQMESVLGEDYIELLQENFFAFFPDDIRYKITKMDTKVDGNKAVVRIMAATMSYTDEDGEKVKEEASGSDMDDFELVKLKGKWYLSRATLTAMGFDLSGLEEDLFDLEDDLDLPVDSREQAVDIVLDLDGVWRWYLYTDTADYEVTDEGGRWLVFLFELDENGDRIPFAWYAVNKDTGEAFEVVE